MRFPSVTLPERALAVQQPPRLAYLASFPPRQCGIATFTFDVMTAVEASTHQPSVAVAMNDRPERYAYESRVAIQIDRNDLSSYVAAARKLSQMPIDVINVQHEYGLFGGEWGEYLLELYERARQPIVTTLHSVIPNPDPVLKRVTRELAERSTKVIVLANAATEILTRDYGILRSKIHMIPHGIPTVTQPARAHNVAKLNLGYQGRTLLSTFGLISPNKGIEFAIRALPEVVSAHPDVLYLVIGQTHPGVRAHEGEAYRTQLQNLVRELHLQANVEFVDRYLSLPQLMEYLLATDAYVIPYLNPTQIVSGTLAYAMGSGKAVISTPFIHAREVLANGNGVLVPFKDSAAMTHAINNLLDHPTVRREMEQRAYASSRSWTWPAVAEQYIDVYEEVAKRDIPVSVF
jgi:glycosyltransferase involved in cell wall biosynthesis